MSFTDLARLVTFRPLQPLDAFPVKERPWSPFRAGWGQTVELLARELRMLGARGVVLELDMAEGDFRLDGLPRAGAKARTPGVILSIREPHGLRYRVDTYRSWEENVRAIALALEALRAVDRYGVTKRGEQYAGWKALSSGSMDSASVERGRDLIRRHGGVREALRATHPDTREQGYTDAAFRSVQMAREMDAA
jgi:hypothetical protein